MLKLTIGGGDPTRARLSAFVVVVIAFAAAPVAANAGVYTVYGSQVSTSETEATMTGGLSGGWSTTILDFRFDDAAGLLVAWGTETFSGCLDRRRNGCDASDPSGTMSFKFKAWQKYDPQNGYAFVTGACIHPVTRGTDGFKGASGVIAMKDTLQPDGTVTTGYAGVLTVPSGMTTKSSAGDNHRSLQTAAPRVTCGG